MLLCPWNSPGKNTGVGCHVLLQGIFPTPYCWVTGKPQLSIPQFKIKSVFFFFFFLKKSGLWSCLIRSLAVVKLVYPLEPYASGDVLSGSPYPIESLTWEAVPLTLNSDGGEDDNDEGTTWAGHSLCSCPGSGGVTSLHLPSNLPRWGSGIPTV